MASWPRGGVLGLHGYVNNDRQAISVAHVAHSCAAPTQKILNSLSLAGQQKDPKSTVKALMPMDRKIGSFTPGGKLRPSFEFELNSTRAHHKVAMLASVTSLPSRP